MSKVFTHKRQVEFNHCDPAGMVFYPRYFEMISSVCERFFSDAVDFSWAGTVMKQGYGTPMGNIEVRFHAASRLEDWLEFSLSIKKIGNASVTFLITCSCAGQPRFTCTATLVYANIATNASHPWPDAPRAAMQHYITPSLD